MHNPTSRIAGPACAVVLFLVAGLTPAFAQNPPVSIDVNAAAARHPIDPRVYGLAHATTADLADLNVTLNRSGGNNTSRYNWQINGDNRGFDWYFESVPYASSAPGEVGDSFIAESRAAGAEPMLTIPMVGWVAKLGANRSKLASFSIAKYGAQTGNDWQWFPDAGNGIWTNGQFVSPNDPNDANVPAGGAFQQGWMQHLVSQWGPASSGGLRYYILDNEHSIWHSTHRDAHPVGAGMDEIKAKILDYAGRIKTVDPTALVVGPEEWGWSGYLLSGYDQQYGATYGWGYLPDREAHGGWDYLPWLLDQLRQNQVATGRRLLDVFSVHYYPQGGEFGGSVSTSMQLRRNRSTRSLWDPSYVDETWINDVVKLVPRLKQWVATYYPGTQTAINEYNWGAEDHINGATAQADVLGIFGREGLDMAARWTTPDVSTPTYKAIKMYRNYDGAGSGFGDTSVAATVPDPDTLAAFAAERSSDGALTVMVVGKSLSGTTPVTVNLASFASSGVAQVWRLTSANVITHPSDIAFGGTSFSASLPAQSITLFVVPRVTVTLSAGNVTVTEGQTGTTNAVFTVSLSTATSASVSVAYATADGTATAGSDYLARSGSLTFAPGSTTASVSVPVLGDHVFEGNETFVLNLASPVNATILDGQGLGTISDDDAPGLAIDDVTVVEGRTGPSSAVFTVALSPPNGSQTVTVAYQTANGSAVAPGDYQAAAGTLTFAPGATARTLAVVVNPDTLLEGPETFTVSLSGAVNAAIASSQGTGTILDSPISGDFSGDGRPDIVWRHAVSGKISVWLMNGVTRTAGVYTTPDTLADTNWAIVGTADFGADGKTDILWRHRVSGKNVVWMMNGVVRTGGVFTNPDTLADTYWRMAATGDLNGDYKPDILFRHGLSGKNVAWYMDGVNRLGGVFTSPSALPDTRWRIAGAGDFSGDGKPDLLWRHTGSGNNVVWMMDGITRTAGVYTNPDVLPDTRWQIVAVADYGDDGRPDILWRHAGSGKNVVWMMNGVNRTSGVYTNPDQLPDTNWKIVGPR